MNTSWIHATHKWIMCSYAFHLLSRSCKSFAITLQDLHHFTGVIALQNVTNNSLWRVSVMVDCTRQRKYIIAVMLFPVTKSLSVRYTASVLTLFNLILFFIYIWQINCFNLKKKDVTLLFSTSLSVHFHTVLHCLCIMDSKWIKTCRILVAQTFYCRSKTVVVLYFRK